MGFETGVGNKVLGLCCGKAEGKNSEVKIVFCHLLINEAKADTQFD